MSVKERLKIYIEYCNLTVSAFEKSINVSNGYVNNMTKSIGIDKLELLLEKYSNLSIDWLIRGKGEMLNEPIEKKYTIPDEVPVMVLKEPCSTGPTNEIVQAQKKTIAILEREVEDLRNDKSFLKNIIETKNFGKDESA